MIKLQRYREIEDKLETYQNKELYPNICGKIDKAKAQEEELKKTIAEIDEMKESM